jgi:hypothetical protein
MLSGGRGRRFKSSHSDHYFLKSLTIGLSGQDSAARRRFPDRRLRSIGGSRAYRRASIQIPATVIVTSSRPVSLTVGA